MDQVILFVLFYLTYCTKYDIRRSWENKGNIMAKNEPKIITPGELSRIILSEATRVVSGVVWFVRGVYEHGNGKSYRGFFYDLLVDQETRESLKLKMPALIRAKLQPGYAYSFRGVLEMVKASGSAGIQVSFVPTQVDDTGSQVDTRIIERAEVLERKARIGKKDVGSVLIGLIAEGKKPRINMVYGKNGIVDKDVMSALGNAVERYEITENRVDFSDSIKIVSALRAADGKYDLIALVRGGGSNLEVFDEPVIAHQMMKMKTPVMAALGHASDVTLTQMVADKSFTTPTALGHFLAQKIEDLDAGSIEIVKITKTSWKLIWATILGWLAFLGTLLIGK